MALTLLYGLLELRPFRNPVDECADGVINGLRDVKADQSEF